MFASVGFLQFLVVFAVSTVIERKEERIDRFDYVLNNIKTELRIEATRTSIGLKHIIEYTTRSFCVVQIATIDPQFYLSISNYVVQQQQQQQQQQTTT